MTYERKSGENPVLLKQRFKDFLKELEKDASLGSLNVADDEKDRRDSVIFDYFDYVEQQKAERVYQAGCSEEDLRKVGSGIRLRVQRLMLEHDRIAPVDCLQSLISVLVSERKLRRRIHPKKDSDPAEDDPYTDIIHLARACRCSVNGTQAEILNQLADILQNSETMKLLNEDGYLKAENKADTRIYPCLEKFISDVLAVSVTYQISDFFRYLENRLYSNMPEKKPDLLLLYFKFQSHYDVKTADEDKQLLEEKSLENKIDQALQFIKNLRTKKNDLLIPVYIDQTTGTGIYIAGSDYFIDQNEIDKVEKARGKRIRPAGLNIIFNQIGNDGDAEKTIFANTLFEKYRKNTNAGYYAGIFNQCCEMTEAMLQALNGPEPSVCPAEYSQWFGSGNFNEVAEAIARQQDAMNG